MKAAKIVFATCLALNLPGCRYLGGDYDVFQMRVVGNQFLAEGVIDHTTPDVVEEALENYPNVDTIVLQWVPGSIDDDANLDAARMVRDAGLTTIVPVGGLVASGGTDFFLAGAQRIVEAGACLGVHTWSTGLGSGIQGRDLPRRDPQHDPYLDYYEDIGIETAFYWYTLEAADIDDLHWMSVAEIRRFGVATEELSNVEADAQSCEEKI